MEQSEQPNAPSESQSPAPLGGDFNGDGSLDSTIELLTGFTPRELETIKQLISASVKEALKQHDTSLPTFNEHTMDKTLITQRSINDLVLSCIREQLNSTPGSQSTNSGTGPVDFPGDGNYAQPRPIGIVKHSNIVARDFEQRHSPAETGRSSSGATNG